jgi:uncharacterized membrane protein YkvI
LGRAWWLFEVAYFLLVILMLSVFAAAAGAIGQALLDWPTLAGTLCLIGAIALFATFGNASVEALFKWVSLFLYATYLLFVAIGLTKFGDKVLASFSLPMQAVTSTWAVGGLAYAGYNIVGAVMVLPVTRHLRSNRDAMKAGLLADLLAMIPAFLFFICMCAYDPQIRTEPLPSDFLLRQMDLPLFHAAFQLMIFLALLESDRRRACRQRARRLGIPPEARPGNTERCTTHSRRHDTDSLGVFRRSIRARGLDRQGIPRAELCSAVDLCSTAADLWLLVPGRAA